MPSAAPTDTNRHLVIGSDPTRHAFPHNRVVNSKYTIITFLPLNFYEQFSRVINCYFLFVAILQFIPAIAPVNPLTTVVPLLVAFSLTAFKDGLDDFQRHKEDNVFNTRKYNVLDDAGEWQERESQDIHVGDIVLLFDRDEVPCDMVLLECSDSDGVAFIRTDNLDGEIDLKPRKRAAGSASDHGIHGSDPYTTGSSLIKYSGSSITCEKPNSHLYQFDSTMLDVSGEEQKDLALTSENLLLQSCFLRNTSWLCGVAVYTGADTKCGVNKKTPPIKIAGVDRAISRYSLRVFAMQMVITLFMSVLGNTVGQTIASRSWYLAQPALTFRKGLLIPFRFFLLTSVMIPISFKVIIDLSKYFISHCIAWDVELYHAETDPEEGGCPAKANNTAIAEDLGQIDIILTDKTGTLTENVMCFKACAIEGVEYGGGGGAFFDTSASPFASAGFVSKLQQHDPGVMAFAHALSLCHSVQVSGYEEIRAVQPGPAFNATNSCNTPEHLETRLSSGYRDIDSGDPRDPEGMEQPGLFAPRLHPKYSAVSPDEEALVKAAAEMGSVLIEHSKAHFILSVGLDEATAVHQSYEILHTFEFSSDRKMMSVLVRNETTQEIELISKGADDRMLCRISDNCEVVEDQIASFASVGLRTLVLAGRSVPEEEYTAWREKYDNAINTTVGEDRGAAINMLYTEFEQGLSLIGATGIEDRLQDGVEQTITSLREAGISFWMLTGDKFETAQQIARSSGLWKRREELLHLRHDSAEQLQADIHHFAKSIDTAAHTTRRRRGSARRSSRWQRHPHPPQGGAASPGPHAEAGPSRERVYGTFIKRLVGWRPRRSSSAADGARQCSEGELQASHSGVMDQQPMGQDGRARKAGPASQGAQQLTNRSFGSDLPHSPDHPTLCGAGEQLGDDEVSGFALILDGKAVRAIFDETERRKRQAESLEGFSLPSPGDPDHPYALLAAFYELCCKCNSVIFCRVTPAQKAMLTRLARSGKDEVDQIRCSAVSAPHERRVLAVGDGGNDVLMIQEATIGVGIVGKEGRQASRAADYSLARFKFLKKLLLVHGHYSYARSSSIVLYCFYKSMLLAMVQVLFNLFTLFSGISYWNSMMLAVWNGFYTLPAPFLLVLDRELPQEHLMSHPALYQASRQGEHFGPWKFMWELVRGAAHSVVSLGFTFVVCEMHSADPSTGRLFDLTDTYTITFTAILFIQVWVVVLLSNTLTLLNFAGIFLMPPIYFASIYAYSAFKASDYYRTAWQVFPQASVWLTILVVNVLLFVPALAAAAYKFYINPTPLSHAKVVSKRFADQRRAGWRSLSLPLASASTPRSTPRAVSRQNRDVCL